MVRTVFRVFICNSVSWHDCIYGGSSWNGSRNKLIYWYPLEKGWNNIGIWIDDSTISQRGVALDTEQCQEIPRIWTFLGFNPLPLNFLNSALCRRCIHHRPMSNVNKQYFANYKIVFWNITVSFSILRLMSTMTARFGGVVKRTIARHSFWTTSSLKWEAV